MVVSLAFISNKLQDEAAAAAGKQCSFFCFLSLLCYIQYQICLMGMESAQGIQDTAEGRNYVHDIFTTLPEFCTAGLSS